MCAQVRPSLAEVQSTGHPADPRMLNEVGRLTPACGKAGEEDHLLSRAIGMWKGVDDSSRGIARERWSRVQLGNRIGCCGIGHIGTVVVETIHGDRAPFLDSRTLKPRQVGKRPELTGGGRASRSPDVGAELRRGEHIQPRHSHAVFYLVVIKRSPLSVGQGTEPPCPRGLVVLIGKFLECHDAGIVAIAILLQRRERDSGLRECENFIRDAESLKTQGAYVCKACDPLVSGRNDAEDSLLNTKWRGVRHRWWGSCVGRRRVVGAWGDGNGRG